VAGPFKATLTSRPVVVFSRGRPAQAVLVHLGHQSSIVGRMAEALGMQGIAAACRTGPRIRK